MKKAFSWYLNPSKDELESAWKKGILTIDTNVLLDLYRYHEDTRKTLLGSIQDFEGKKWISYQAATEFFRNRTKVIISSEKAFKQAQDETEKLSASLASAISNLKGNRIIPAALAGQLDSGIQPIISQTQAAIKAAKENYPKFLQHDPILDQLLKMFDGSVGDDFKEDKKEEIKKEAERRRKEKIPPGYLDDEKDDDRPYGDYFLWRQVLDKAKSENCPIIFVTSERKEDWWEKISGKTTGPRPELQKEALQVSGQRIFIFQTERFVQYTLERSKQPVNETAIEEIRAINSSRVEFDPAIRLLEQVEGVSTPTVNSGTLLVELRRSVRNFTVSGHLRPNMRSVPGLNVKLLESPVSMPSHKISAGTGTTHDFNIHLVCNEFGVRLPMGVYTFAYDAQCNVPNEEIEQASTPD